MRIHTIVTGVAAVATAVMFTASVVMAADEHVASMKELAATKVKEWIGEPIVIEAIKAQNAKHASLSQADIDALDQKWRAETKSGGGGHDRRGSGQ